MGEDSVTISNGETVYVNDHVYVSAPWAMRDSNIPYTIGRIMEFLPPDDDLKGKGKGKTSVTRARIAWYYRPGDLSERVSPDPRLLLAAIYSEPQPISYFRGKCHVRHRDMISDLGAWRKKPDSFYYYRLFDPYIKRDFEVLRSCDINNVPSHIKASLMERYSFVAAEKEVISDLTDAFRTCDTCTKWCPAAESVRCDSCKNFFHMHCVQPPLAAKPAKGYGWTCAPCSKKHDEQVDRQGGRSETPPRPPKPRNQRKQDVSASIGLSNKGLENEEIHYFRMWPFRYFGFYSFAQDALDPDDFIYPRAIPRVGIKFQASCPSSTEGAQLRENNDGEPVRGGDETVEVMSSICNLSEEDVKMVDYYKNRMWHKPEQKYLVDFIDEAVRRFSQARGQDEISQVRMKGVLRSRKWQAQDSRYFDREWNDEEARMFDQAIRSLGGAEVRAIQKEVNTRSIAEVVRYYGKWKNDQLRQKRQKAGAAMNRNIHKSANLRRSSGSHIVSDELSDLDDNTSIYEAPLASNGSRPICGACKSKESQYWWKTPRGFDLHSSMLCDSCNTSWRKYAELKIGRADDFSKNKGTEKRDNTPLAALHAKRTKIDPVEGSPSPQLPQRTCSCCKKLGPYTMVLSCYRCGVSAHASCAGVDLGVTQSELWMCELCENEKNLESSLDTRCLMCAHALPEVQLDRRDENNQQSFLRIAKPTENRGWVHVLCAIFSPEVQFADATRLRLVEGLSTVPLSKRKTSCSICSREGGIVVRCSDGTDSVHPSCAWLAGFTFGFEIQSVKASRKDQLHSVTFRNDTGVLVPTISRGHGRKLYGFCDRDSLGESVFQLYCREYKQAPLDHSYGLLRKAQRMDGFLHSKVSRVQALSPTVEQECYECQTRYSPYFWPAGSPGSFTQLYRCHQCHLKHDHLDVNAVVEQASVVTDGTT